MTGSSGPTYPRIETMISLTGFSASVFDPSANRLSHTMASVSSLSAYPWALVEALRNVGSRPLSISFRDNVPIRLYFSSNTRMASGLKHFSASIMDFLITPMACRIVNQYGICG